MKALVLIAALGQLWLLLVAGNHQADNSNYSAPAMLNAYSPRPNTLHLVGPTSGVTIIKEGAHCTGSAYYRRCEGIEDEGNPP